MNGSMHATAPAGLKALPILWIAGLLVSGWSRYDRTTWLLEIFPTLIALPVMWMYSRKLR